MQISGTQHRQEMTFLDHSHVLSFVFRNAFLDAGAKRIERLTSADNILR